MEENARDTDLLSRAEELIEKGELDEAQRLIFGVDENSGRKYYLQSALFNAKGWYNEQRKQLKLAIEAEPENEEYRRELEELENFCGSGEYKKMRDAQNEEAEKLRESNKKKKEQDQMGGKDGLATTCCLCSCEACGSGICESICDGCS